MFIVIYTFHVKPGQQDSFCQSWHRLTEFIYEYESSLGSRLHGLDDQTFLAYAQWPDRETWKKAGDNLPVEADAVRKQFRDALERMETTYELDVTDDLLKRNVYTGEAD